LIAGWKGKVEHYLFSMEEAPPLFGGVGCEVPNAKKLHFAIIIS